MIPIGNPLTSAAAKAAASVQQHRLNWRIKAVLPVATVLVIGLLAFVAVTLTFDRPEEHGAVMIVATAGAVVICAVILAVMAVFIQRPMVELQEKIARVHRGDMTASVSFASRNDEIGDLGNAFNQMVCQLRESREEIQRLHRTQMTRAEHLATLGELAAGLAHEIRNPLAGIAGVIDIIGRDLPESSPAREVLKDVKLEVQHINRTLTDLLECARPKAPEMRLADLNATAEHAVMFARQQAHARHVTLEMVREEGLPSVEHDPGQLHQVLLNLLLNAIQAIEGPGVVRVRVEAREGQAAVTVSDSGRGMSPDLISQIFRPFFTTKGNGTGLGLSLARRIVEDHGGQIAVSSQPGQGTEFTVLLPMRAAVAHASASWPAS